MAFPSAIQSSQSGSFMVYHINNLSQIEATLSNPQPDQEIVIEKDIMNKAVHCINEMFRLTDHVQKTR